MRKSLAAPVAALTLAILLGVTPRASAVGGMDGVGCYRYSDTLPPVDGNQPTVAFDDIAATGTRLPLGDDQVSAALPLGFAFNLYGAAYTQVYVTSNGFLSFLKDQGPGLNLF